MAFFYLLLFSLLIFGIIGVVVYFFTGLTKRLKIAIALSLFSGWLLVFGFTIYQDKTRERHKELLYAFEHQKALWCKGYLVDKKNFNFVSGTMVFVGREKTPYEGLTISIDECEIK